MYFGPEEITCTRNAFHQAEKLMGKHFGLIPDAWRIHRYDVKTLAHLKQHEVHEGVFAQLCRYPCEPEHARSRLKGFHFYRICLQDNRILDALRRGSSFIKLVPLMLYIATHELVHVVRFDRGESNFDMAPMERKKEEERVHDLTREVLKPVTSREINLVLECFSNDYLIEKLSN